MIRRQQTFGYTEEELRILLAPMAATGLEPIGSMGTDTPIAAISNRPRLIFDYFSQLFAQVTNPPLDAPAEEIVTAVLQHRPGGQPAGSDPGRLPTGGAAFPVIDNDELAKILHINLDGDLPGFQAARISGLYRVEGGHEPSPSALDEICAEMDELLAEGVRFVVLRIATPITSMHRSLLLLTSAVHHHLVRHKTRTQMSLLIEAGDVREVHHVALLIGYGAAAVNPYLAMETVEDLVASGYLTGSSPPPRYATWSRRSGRAF